MTNEVYLKIAAGVLATVGFGIIFRIKPKLLPFIALNGLIACEIYFVLTDLIGGSFFPNLIAAFAVAALSEAYAIIMKAPSTVFLLAGSIALVPGGTLYYTMSNLINQNYEASLQNLLITVKVGVAIGGGIIAASFIRYLFSLLNKFNKSKNRAGN